MRSEYSVKISSKKVDVMTIAAGLSTCILLSSAIVFFFSFGFSLFMITSQGNSFTRHWFENSSQPQLFEQKDETRVSEDAYQDSIGGVYQGVLSSLGGEPSGSQNEQIGKVLQVVSDSKKTLLSLRVPVDRKENHLRLVVQFDTIEKKLKSASADSSFDWNSAKTEIISLLEIQ